MVFTTGYGWLDLIYFILAVGLPALYVFKPVKEKSKEDKKEDRRILGGESKAGGRTGYYTKGQQDFNINMFLWGFLVTFFLIILPWIFQEIGWFSF
ncbi:MAG: hypothetical protein JKX82_00150 [Oleispira sp.]|nr:hypothetical protein [Oleispira sp.]